MGYNMLKMEYVLWSKRWTEERREMTHKEVKKLCQQSPRVNVSARDEHVHTCLYVHMVGWGGGLLQIQEDI